MDLATSDKYHAMSVDSFDTTKLLTNAARQRDARKLNEFPIFDTNFLKIQVRDSKPI